MKMKGRRRKEIQGRPVDRQPGSLSWQSVSFLIIAMLAIGFASIYASRIIDGNGDHFDWFMSVILVIIGISNALQFIYSRRKR